MSALRTINVTVLNCPRCGDNHDELELRELASVPLREDCFTHWVACPVRIQPILINLEVEIR